jgi:AraC family transcriptional activator FtrA
VLVMPGMRAFDVAAVMEVLADDRTDRSVPRNDVVICGHRSEIELDHGFTLHNCLLIGTLDRVDLLIVPGFQDPQSFIESLSGARVQEAIEVVRSAHVRGAVVASLCTGAFLVAAAGLFNGLAATTHWRYCALLQSLHPRIRVETNVLYTDDEENRVWSSAGVTAGIDLCLAIVAREHGSAAAAAVARSMVLPATRSGGQAQYVPPRYRESELTPASLVQLSTIVRTNLAHPWTLTDLAARAGTSKRTLQREFASALGRSPGQWLVQERVTAARELLEYTSLSVEEIAHRVGFSSSDLLRKHFTRGLRTSPSNYRRSFMVRPESEPRSTR